jgi:hypothetical protein
MLRLVFAVLPPPPLRLLPAPARRSSNWVRGALEGFFGFALPSVDAESTLLAAAVVVSTNGKEARGKMPVLRAPPSKPGR